MSHSMGSFEANGVAIQTAQPSLASSLLRNGSIVLAGSAFIAICAHLSIPLFFTPVPVTLQPFAVVLLGMLLSPRLAFGAAVAYLVEGTSGLPVFTPSGPGGMLQLLGPTGGYLFSYSIVAPLVATLWRRSSRSFSRGLIVASIGSLVILTLGALWLGIELHRAPLTVAEAAILPFLPGDVLKVVLAAAIASTWARFRRTSSAQN